MSEKEGPILYVMVIGFHHKKGCQIEYSFPALVPGAPNECPSGWKYLPTLALPDGSHNFDEDTAYFHLPSLTNPKQTVYGISCFRQIPVEKIKNKTADITRGTVQKSVCVLSKLPLYGHIQVKMALITHAYFEEGDFSKVSLLEDTYHHLNSVLAQNDLSAQTFVGLSARDFILQWRHKAILLFKLLLLEKRVVFFRSPVQSLCSTILTLLSLHPYMIEQGLKYSACVKLSRPMSPMPDFSDEDPSPVPSPKIKLPNCSQNSSKGVTKETIQENEPTVPSSANDEQDTVLSEAKDCTNLTDNNLSDQSTNNKENDSVSASNKIESDLENTEIGLEITENFDVSQKSANRISPLNDDDANNIRRDVSSEAITEHNVHSNIASLGQINIENCGFPLAIFTHGYLCLPYLSLPYMDLLSDVNVRGYIVGATNVLFKQKRQLSDILVDIESGKIECQDPELRKQLHLNTEDLRFADYIVKHVAEERHDVFLDGVGWEGGDEWIRTQFRVYMLCLARTALLQDGGREVDHFNANFVSAWKDTHNYKMWRSEKHDNIDSMSPGHPFAGQLSVSDMKLRFAHTMQNTESGRKLNQAMISTGRAVATTSKAVGGALSQAKGAFSSWLNHLLVSPDVQKGVEQAAETNVDSTEENLNSESMVDNADSDDVLNSLNKNMLNGSIVKEVETNNQKTDKIVDLKISGFVDNTNVLDENVTEKLEKGDNDICKQNDVQIV